MTHKGALEFLRGELPNLTESELSSENEGSRGGGGGGGGLALTRF
jgi:hypothetical protein